MTRHEKTYEIMNINPDVEEIVGFVWAGVPESIPEPPTRLELNECVRFVE